MGVLKLTMASTSHSPVTVSASATAVPNAPVRMDMTMSVKITRPNMASVSPVRNLALMG